MVVVLMLTAVVVVVAVDRGTWSRRLYCWWSRVAGEGRRDDFRGSYKKLLACNTNS